MVQRRGPQISSRKQPKQARASDLVAAVLEAAIQVLRVEGAARFTTARVAERAGVSVGSVYQYFPNKAAILFRLQSDEWRETSALMREILEDASRAPPERLRRLVHAFLRSECDEAEVRLALGDAAPLYREAPEALAARGTGSRVIRAFMGVALPGVDVEVVTLAAEVVGTTLTQVGRTFSAVERSGEEIAAYADAVADMFCAYLERLCSTGAAGRG